MEGTTDQPGWWRQLLTSGTIGRLPLSADRRHPLPHQVPHRCVHRIRLQSNLDALGLFYQRLNSLYARARFRRSGILRNPLRLLDPFRRGRRYPDLRKTPIRQRPSDARRPVFYARRKFDSHPHPRAPEAQTARGKRRRPKAANS